MSQVWTHPVSGAKQSPPKGSSKPTQVMLWRRRRSGGRSHVKVWSVQLSAVSSGELHLHRWTSQWRASSSGDSLASWRSPPPGASHTGNHTSIILTLLWADYVVDNQYLVFTNSLTFRSLGSILSFQPQPSALLPAAGPQIPPPWGPHIHISHHPELLNPPRICWNYSWRPEGGHELHHRPRRSTLLNFMSQTQIQYLTIWN